MNGGVAKLEPRLADMEEDAAEAEAATQMASAAAASQKIEAQAFHRRRPARRPLPDNLPRERVVYPTTISPTFTGRRAAGRGPC